MIPPHIFARRQAQAEREARVAKARENAERELEERQARSDAFTDRIRARYNETMRATGGITISARDESRP